MGPLYARFVWRMKIYTYVDCIIIGSDPVAAKQEENAMISKMPRKELDPS
jgi:hypothetical protein